MKFEVIKFAYSLQNKIAFKYHEQAREYRRALFLSQIKIKNLNQTRRYSGLTSSVSLFNGWVIFFYPCFHARNSKKKSSVLQKSELDIANWYQ